MKKFYLFFVLSILTVVIHFVSVYAGIYERQIATGSVWIDNILHITFGAAVAFLWLWALETKFSQHSKTFFLLSTLGFVLGVAVLWEVFEFLFSIIFTEQAFNLKIYSPTVGESLGDIFSNLLGGLLVLAFLREKTMLVS